MYVDGKDISAHFRLRSLHGLPLYLLPVLSQVGQVEVVIHKLVSVENKGLKKQWKDGKGSGQRAFKCLH